MFSYLFDRTHNQKLRARLVEVISTFLYVLRMEVHILLSGPVTREVNDFDIGSQDVEYNLKSESM